ncbi:MAG TPA: M48 family metalloprotease [Terriglobia bacterium]|nr:M48 family metalloprotease [Terriglobia bacterium]
MKRALTKPLLVLVLLSLAAQALAQSTGPVFPNPGKTSMSKQNQSALGMEVAAQVYQQMPVLPDNSPVSQYVRQLGQKLVATIPPENSWPFEFHVVPQKEINAFALPGGQMFINVGTITAAKNESELAGVMGHEMAHVYMQHSAKQAGKAQTTGMLAGIASAVLGGTVGNKAGGLVGQLGQMGLEVGAQGLMMKYSRNDETQADTVGAVILYKAGYNPQGMVDFFKTMGAEGGSAPPEFFSSHPNPNNRQQAIAKQIAAWPAANYVESTPNFEKIRASAMEMRVYSAEEIQKGAKSGQWAALNKKNGATLKSGAASEMATRANAGSPPAAVPLDSVLPSQRMVDADLGPLKIRRPENWRLTLPEKPGQFATIAPQAGTTTSGVGYGVLLNGVPGAKGQQMSIDDMTSLLIQQIQESNELEQASKPQPITVGGVEGRSTYLRSPSPFPGANGQTQAERDWLVSVPQRGGGLIFMIFVAPEADFTRFQPTFEAMVKSVQFK